MNLVHEKMRHEMAETQWGRERANMREKLIINLILIN